MPLEGKGMFIWKLHHCEAGNPAALVKKAQAAGFTHVLIKIADGSRAYNVDLAERAVEAFKGAGIKTWGWQFIYGDEPFHEASIARHRIRMLQLDGFIVNAETAYKKKFAEATAYMERLRISVGNIPIGLSSFRYPHYHADFPWTEFLTLCDFNMPQVYWVRSDNPADQLDRCIAQFQKIYPVRPIIPTGSAYEEFGWRPRVEELSTFMQHARKIGLPAVNFWSWDYAGNSDGEDFWHVIAAYKWPVKNPVIDIVGRFSGLLNQGNIKGLVKLYHPDATLVTPTGIYQGKESLLTYYHDLIMNILPGAAFKLEPIISEGETRYLKWRASGAANRQSVTESHDTLVLRQGLIQFHSSIYDLV